MWRRLLSITSGLLFALAGSAQELNCKVMIVSDKITGVDPQVFTAMQRSIADFMNTRKWSNDEFGSTEKIDCNILITLVANKVGGDADTYDATFNIQAVRPVYGASYNSTIVNYSDKEFKFRFTQFNPINFNDNQASGSDAMLGNLPAVLAYYAYIVLGLDYDSFSPLGGTAFYKKAQNIVNNAPDAKVISGWKATESQKNRYWLVDQLLNTRFQEVRNFWYTMHREGLDSMYTKPVDARTRVLTNVRKLFQVNRENPSSALMQFVVNSKSDEFLKLLTATPKADRPQFITLLSALDVPNAAKYNALR